MASYRGIVAGLAVCLMGVAALPLVAQQGPSGGNGGGDRMAQMRQRMTTQMKESLGCTDEEFKAIQPKLEKVMQLRMQSIAVQELNKVLQNKDAKAEEIQAKLKAVREAKKTAKEALTKAQDELRELLTVRQEAQMVANGILE